MTLRRWLAAAFISAGLSITGTTGAAEKARETEKKVAEFTFGSLRTLPADQARTQAEAWLKTTGKFDAEAFQAIWSKAEAPVLDRVLATLEMGSPEARTILAEARNATASAPKAVPAMLKDRNQNAFLRSNLALGFARSLASARVFEESLDALKLVTVDQVVDPSSFLFHKAVAEHGLTKKDEAVATIIRLIDDVLDAPDRYKMVATIMFIDMRGWSKDEKDLNNIARLMDNSGRRLDLARGGVQTQEIQKKIVFRLDELIKELENEKKSNCSGNGGNCPNGSKPGSGSGSGPPTSPMDDSKIATNGGAGTVDEKKIKALADKWGQLPDHERAKALQDITKDLPAKFKIVVEDYFKAVSSIQR